MSYAKMGRKSERRVAKTMGARLTHNSGASSFDKGDMTLSEFPFGRLRLEAKSTSRDSFSIKRETLEKIVDEASAAGDFPAFTISFVLTDGRPKRAGEWAMIPLDIFRELLALAKESK